MTWTAVRLLSKGRAPQDEAVVPRNNVDKVTPLLSAVVADRLDAKLAVLRIMMLQRQQRFPSLSHARDV